ncbi:MAG: 30S ribosomal protein S18 [Pedobacter sp.]|nr:MAG: 30S ribosomal protein S18 [Pedobacter sp.]
MLAKGVKVTSNRTTLLSRGKNGQFPFIDKKSLASEDEKKTPVESSKKNLIYWKQRYRSVNNLKTAKANFIAGKPEAFSNEKAEGSLKYVSYLQTPAASFTYSNIKLLKMFITKSGKIKPRRRTRVSLGQQRKLSKAIRKARSFGLLPFICVVRDLTKEKKHDRKKDLRRNRKV